MLFEVEDMSTALPMLSPLYPKKNKRLRLVWAEEYFKIDGWTQIVWKTRYALVMVQSPQSIHFRDRLAKNWRNFVLYIYAEREILGS